MKAEVRKQLETNELREQFNRLLHAGKKPPSVLWLFLVLGVAVALGYWWLSSRTANRNAEAWERYWKQRALMDAVGAELKGTPAEVAIQLDAADAKFEEGYERLFKSPDLAVEELRAASTAYEELSKQTAGRPDLQLRAYSGAGKASEACGDLPRAIQFYQAAKKLGEQTGWVHHPLVLDAAARLERLEGNASLGKEFYQRWPARLPKSQPAGGPPPVPTPPAAVTMPTLPTTPAPTTPAPTSPTEPTLPDALKPMATGSLLSTQPAATIPAAGAPPAPSASAPSLPAAPEPPKPTTTTPK